MQNLQVLELKGQRVLTTRQLAEAYETEIKVIQNNFSRNKERYIAGKHFIYMDRDELRELKTHPQFEGELRRTSRAHFWTEKGALLHAKSLNTDKAWEVYDYLVDFYFRAKEQDEKKEIVPVQTSTEPIRKSVSIPPMDDAMSILRVLLLVVEEHGIQLRVKELRSYRSCLRGNRIAVHKYLPFEQIVYEVAWELAHYFIHYENGDLINNPLKSEYDAQATKAANLIIDILNQKTAKY